MWFCWVYEYIAKCRLDIGGWASQRCWSSTAPFSSSKGSAWWTQRGVRIDLVDIHPSLTLDLVPLLYGGRMKPAYCISRELHDATCSVDSVVCVCVDHLKRCKTCHAGGRRGWGGLGPTKTPPPILCKRTRGDWPGPRRQQLLISLTCFWFLVCWCRCCFPFI